VTGSSRGIGKSIAKLFLENNIATTICARKIKQLKSTFEELKKINENVFYVKGDVSKYENVKRIVRETIKKFGRIDFLVNNAAILIAKPLVEISEKEWKYLIDTNLNGVFFFCKEVLPIMIKQNFGVIVNISSGAGHYAFENLSAYCASKFGVMAITQSLSKEVEKYNIKVFAVCPGAVDTDMQREYLGEKLYKEYKNSLIKPEKVAEKVLEICLNYKKFRSGSCFDIY